MSRSSTKTGKITEPIYSNSTSNQTWAVQQKNLPWDQEADKINQLSLRYKVLSKFQMPFQLRPSQRNKILLIVCFFPRRVRKKSGRFKKLKTRNLRSSALSSQISNGSNQINFDRAAEAPPDLSQSTLLQCAQQEILPLATSAAT